MRGWIFSIFFISEGDIHYKNPKSTSPFSPLLTLSVKELARIILYTTLYLFIGPLNEFLHSFFYHYWQWIFRIITSFLSYYRILIYVDLFWTLTMNAKKPYHVRRSTRTPTFVHFKISTFLKEYVGPGIVFEKEKWLMSPHCPRDW